MRDGISSKQVKRGISPAYVLNNTAFVSEIIDVQGFDAASFLIGVGVIGDADATFAALLEESDASDMSGSNAVDDADMVSQTPGTAPEAAAGFIFSSDNQVRKLGYIGIKRYIRLTITPTSNSVASPAIGAYVCAIAVLEHAAHEPITQATA